MYASSGFTCKPGKLRADKRRPYNCSKKKNGRIVARVRFITVGNDG